MRTDLGDTFSNAETYEAFVGRWSRLVAHQFIAWLDIAPAQTWLDVGAGTGVLSQVILQAASPVKVVGIDLSSAYIDFARQRIRDDRVEFTVGDAADLAFAAPQFDVAVAGLVLNFLPSPQHTVASMTHAVGNGGTVAAYVWDYGGQMEMMRYFWDIAARLDPSAAAMDSGQRFTICKPDNLRALFESVALKAIDVIPIDIQTRFTDFDDYWQPFLDAQGSVSKYLRGLDDAARTALRDELQKRLPTTDDGAIPLVARAWAVKGRRDTSA